MSTPAAASRSTSTPPACSWEISPPGKEDGGATPDRTTNGRTNAGGIAFDVKFDEPTAAKPAMRSTQRAKPPLAPSAAASITSTGGGGGGAVASASASASTFTSSEQPLAAGLPVNLFSAATSLPAKVETLRMYLEEKLGVATFQKVYAYVSREENGEQESGEREAILALLAHQKDQLPLVHTLVYLQEALDG